MKFFLVINTAYFGDTILTDALVRSIKTQFTDSYIVFVANKQFFEVARYMDGVDETWAYDKKGENKGIIGFYKFYKKIKNKYCFDAAFVINGNERGILLARLLRCKRIYADNRGIFNLLVNNGLISYGNKVHVQDRYSALLELYSKRNVEEKKIIYNPPDEANRFVEKLQAEEGIIKLNDIVLISPTSKAKEKDLRLNTCVQLVHNLRQIGKIPAIIGAGEVAKQYVRTLNDVGCEEFLNFVDKTSFSELGALMQKCYALISVDTGTLHFGLALDVPVVAIFYVNTELKLKRWAPKDIYKHRLIADGDFSASNIMKQLIILKEIYG
ncbi:MAG: glycosyltransferase family 9 protein [Phascolarctobacterium sp.]|nr:glycosyltransferase family 9 protein [Phascolarctobacterium sp.]